MLISVGRGGEGAGVGGEPIENANSAPTATDQTDKLQNMPRSGPESTELCVLANQSNLKIIHKTPGRNQRGVCPG